MRSYKQHCGLAKALDVIGDRWTLLVIRELLLQGPCRYTDLKNGLPGIATNLLSDRLRELEAAGLVLREEAAPPVATTLFRLTEAGDRILQELTPAHLARLNELAIVLIVWLVGFVFRAGEGRRWYRW